MTSLHGLLDVACARWPDRVALRHGNRSWTYSQFRSRSLKLAGGLAATGVVRGDRVVVCLQNRPEVLEAAMASSSLGAIFVPASPVLRSRQLGHILRDSGAVFLIVSESPAISLSELRRECPSLQTIALCGGRGVAVGSATGDDGTIAYEELLTANNHASTINPIGRDPASIFYTSGSTGRPKGVIFSHENIVAGASIVSSYLGNVADDRLLAALPLSFDYGFSQATTAISVGACVVLTGFSLPATLLNQLIEEQITGLAGVPTMWMQLLASDWPAGLDQKLRYITNSGGKLPPAAMRLLQQRLPGTKIFSMYGLTEAFRSTYLPPDQVTLRPESIGKAVPDQEVLVLRDDGVECQPGEVGELVHRGSLVTLGYWNDRELTAARFRPLRNRLSGLPSGELAVWSGDKVRTDNDGYLYFVARNDQMIKSSGHRISPTEIEDVVSEVPGVAEVAAFGLPDIRLGQRVVVAVVAEKQPAGDLIEQIARHCRTQLPPYMSPSEVRVIGAMPTTPNGKADKATLSQAWASDHLLG